jgi:hypothetical protein
MEMTDDIVTRLQERIPYAIHPHVLAEAKLLSDTVKEIERLRADIKELLDITKLFADEGKCREYEDEFGYCAHSDCGWHGAEHLWESFCMSRGI